MAQKPPSPVQLIGLGSAVVVLVVGCSVLGWFIDGRAHTSPVFVFVGLAVGIASACLYSYVQFRKFL
ncbi:AtpZ/AtpI family protein [Gandjariella thermophila]|uniref:AtpZ/AtpI family protein n=1 Tax=Gandjariella thermophila TaxID=1931992 RepID=UPI0010F9591A